MKNKAIVIAVNPSEFRDFPEEKDRGDIEFHKRHCDENGAVYWHLPGHGNNHAWIGDVKFGYFSEPVKRVTYNFDVVEIKTTDELASTLNKERKYIPGTRLEYFDEWRKLDRQQHYLWIKIRNLRRFVEEMPLRTFRKALGRNAGEPVRMNRNYVIVYSSK